MPRVTSKCWWCSRVRHVLPSNNIHQRGEKHDESQWWRSSNIHEPARWLWLDSLWTVFDFLMLIGSIATFNPCADWRKNFILFEITTFARFLFDSSGKQARNSCENHQMFMFVVFLLISPPLISTPHSYSVYLRQLQLQRRKINEIFISFPFPFLAAALSL